VVTFDGAEVEKRENAAMTWVFEVDISEGPQCGLQGALKVLEGWVRADSAPDCLTWLVKLALADLSFRADYAVVETSRFRKG